MIYIFQARLLYKVVDNHSFQKLLALQLQRSKRTDKKNKLKTWLLVGGGVKPGAPEELGVVVV
jgi:hypothetical protein